MARVTQPSAIWRYIRTYSAIPNTATGFEALYNNTFGDENIAIGVQALYNNTWDPFNGMGCYNTALGFQALFNNAFGFINTAVGWRALYHNTTGSGNTALGNFAGSNVSSANNVICIGTAGDNVDESCFIGNIFGATSPNGVGVFVDSFGRLGTMTSSARYKDEIKPMGKVSEDLFAITPVSFRYKKEIDPAGTSQLGLVAEDVEKVNPDLVVRDKEEKPYSVRYDQINAMLLNEFLKEHRKIEQQKMAITQLKSVVAKQEAIATQQQKDFQTITARQEEEIKVLSASLKEQARQIRNVSVQLELDKSAIQTAANSQ